MRKEKTHWDKMLEDEYFLIDKKPYLSKWDKEILLALYSRKRELRGEVTKSEIFLEMPESMTVGRFDYSFAKLRKLKYIISKGGHPPVYILGKKGEETISKF